MIAVGCAANHLTNYLIRKFSSVRCVSNREQSQSVPWRLNFTVRRGLKDLSLPPQRCCFGKTEKWFTLKVCKMWVVPISSLYPKFSQLRDVTHTNFRSLQRIDFTITSYRGQSPNVIANHNFLGGCDSQSHLDFDPDAFERRISSHQSISHETACTMFSHFSSASSDPLFQGA